MAENKICSQSQRDVVCIEANRVLDSCRDRDCFEEVGVYLTDFGREIIEHTGNVRVKCAEIAWTCITVDPVQFNRGFYTVNIRFFLSLKFEACVGGRNQEFEGVTALDKKVVLFGGECGSGTFHSGSCDNPCDPEPTSHDTNSPKASVDVASPVVLSAHIAEVRDSSCCCNLCCCADEIPQRACRNLGAPLSRDFGERVLVVSIGIFSVVRLTRPGQFLVSASEYSVPDKECSCGEDKDPCCLFRSMDFPSEEFSCAAYAPRLTSSADGRCGCRGDRNF